MVRPWVKKAVLIAVAAFLLAQVFPVHRDNPPVDASKTIYSTFGVPADVHAIFERSCRDCHSSETTWPWYSHFAPVSWKVADDVHQGRRHFSLSDWGTYPAEKQQRKLGEICEQVKTKEMPDQFYAMVHSQAKLTPDERESICKWTQSAQATMSGAPAVQAGGAR
jgi:hypothetical protein